MRNVRLIISILFFAYLVYPGASLPSHAGVIAPDLQTVLQTLSPGEEISVIVTLSDQADLSLIKEKEKHLKRQRIIRALKEKAEMTQGSLRAFLKSRKSKRMIPLWVKNAVAVTVPSDVIAELEKFPGVGNIRMDAVIQAPVPPIILSAAPLPPYEWNISAIKAPDLWELGFTGAGIVVANMDTGVDYLHPDLNSKWRGGSNSWYNPYAEIDNASRCASPFNCTACELSASEPCDVSGHGTGTMGIMAGGDAGGSAIGVAPDAEWIAVKVFNDAAQPETFSSVVHQSFQWLLDPDGTPATDDAPAVVNISWGFDQDPGECITEFQSDTEALRAADIAVAYSAGNAGSRESTSISPANYPLSFAAGATTVNNIIASFSSRGPSACDGSIFPEIVAPGVNIRTSTVSDGGFLNYNNALGTSFAAPHVAGAMALLLSAFPLSDTDEIEWALKYSAFDLGSQGADNFYGYGLIDAFGAYNALQSLHPGISLSPLSLDFGSLEAGSSSLAAMFQLTNKSMEDVRVNTALIAGRNAAEFLVLNDTCTGQLITPSNDCIIEAIFSPLFQGSKDAEIEISFEDPGIRSAHILLSGNGLLCPVSFQDVPDGYWAERYIENLYCNEITTGCSVDPLLFCPEGSVLRAQAAAFIIRPLFGEDFPYNPSPYFTDVPDTHWAFKYVQKMFEEGFSTGYIDGTFRPGGNVSRAQVAVFIIRALFGENFPYDATPHFTDVPATYWAFRYIQKMFEEGIVTGYQDGTYRPEAFARRDEMSAALARAFLGM